MRIAIGSNKGGVGKTTLAINIASALSQNHSVVIVDADPQRSVSHWKSIAGDKNNLDVVSLGQKDEILTVAKHYDHCIIDCPPSVEMEATIESMLAAEFFLIPVLPSPLDLWASLRIEEELTRVREEGNASLKAALVLNQVEPRTKLSSQVADVLKQLSIPNLETQIRRRIVFRNAILDGRSVFEAGKKGQDAAAEISAVLKEIL